MWSRVGGGGGGRDLGSFRFLFSLLFRFYFLSIRPSEIKCISDHFYVIYLLID